MSKTNVKRKVLDTSSNWLKLAEDAERDAIKARERGKQLSEAARIFRGNAQSGMPWPEQKVTRLHAQSINHKSEPCHTS
jgi:hypothetical protein